MATAAPWISVSRASEPCSVGMLSSPKEILSLSSYFQPFLQDDGGICDPRFFLASVCPRAWIPRVMVVKRGQEVLGLLYAKERKVAGAGIGIVYADATLGAMILAAPHNREEVFATGLKGLVDLRGARGLRLLVQPNSTEHQRLQDILAESPQDTTFKTIQNHSVLALPDSYETWLEGLGKKTRRNFRYYRRKFDAAGGTYVHSVAQDEFRQAGENLVKKPVVGADEEGLARALCMVSAAKNPLLTGLRGADGKWLGILGGWLQDGRATVFMQMNEDREYAGSSLSVVLRGYLIENLIQSGVQEVVFWAGVGAPLSNYVTPIPTLAAYLDKPTVVWRTCRALVNAILPMLPPHRAEMVGWITGGGLTSAASLSQSELSSHEE